ncbi:hypothetical protein UlMin_043310 [Ulmus minor]
MMKLSRFLASSRKHQLSKKGLNWQDGNVKAELPLHNFAHRAAISTSGESFAVKGSMADRTSVPFTVYKGKAALSVTPILPTFTKLDSGMQVVDRRGVMMLKFMPAIAERKYDWEKRQLFALNPTEVGSLISLGPKDSCEFFHDPSMLSSNAGQVRKTLQIKALPNGNGYMISLTVMNNVSNTRDNFNVPFTTAEFAVVKTACSYALPHILGWDRLTNKIPRGTEGPKFDQQFASEWDK